MSSEDYFKKTQSFLEEKPFCHRAIQPLSESAEIGIVIGESLRCAVLKKDSKPHIEARPANKPDVVFYLSPEAVDTLVLYAGDDVGEFGVEVIKQYLAGTVQIKVPGRITQILAHGYLGILKQGGRTLAQFLATQGASGLTKWIAAIQKLKHRS